MRSDEFAEPPVPRAQRVLVFGDSVVFGGAQTDQSLIATSVLQARLRERLASAEVGNVSAGSWGPGNWLGYARAFGFHGASDVILVISSHDASDNPTFSPLNPLTHPTQNPPSALQELLSRYLNAARIKYQLSSWGWPLQGSQKSDPIPNQPGPESADAKATLKGMADLDAFLVAAQASGARVSAVQFWERREVVSGEPLPGNKRILQVLKRHRVPVTQSLPVFRTCSPNPAQDLFVDAIHPYTRAGQACLAKALQLALAAAGGT